MTSDESANEYEIDLARRELRIRGAAVPVGGRAFEIIAVLALAAGALVTKDELLNRVWPGAIVSENTLHVHATAIRKALGPYRTLLKTEQGRGYRLLGDWNVQAQGAGVSDARPVGPRRMGTGGDVRMTNLPAPATRLIGRTAAVARLRDLVSAGRLVTLTGPGGIGKTSLALEAAREIVSGFADGGWLVELASLSDPALVPAAVSGALRLPTAPVDVSPETIARSVRDKKILLVLDNCEHLIEAVANLTDTLLTHCPYTTIIATSREILRVQGEHVYRVLSLDVPASGRHEAEHILNSSAVELFIAGMERMDTEFTPGTGVLPSIGAICRRLDGIPLAIEFAAARAAALGVKYVATSLNNRFELLTTGRRTALPRHRTLRATLDWSYELLTEAEQHLLRHLAIFSSGFTVEAAAAVVNDGGVVRLFVLEGIANLVAKSLVSLDRDGSARWFLLETVRAYALEKLDAHGERDMAARRLAMYFRDRFPRTPRAYRVSISQNDQSDRFREVDNVRLAIDWCFSAGGDKALGVDLTAGYGLGISIAVATMGGGWQSLDLLTKALDAAESLGDLDAQARALFGLFTHHSYRIENDRALSASERLARVADRLGDVALSRHAGRLMGNALVMLGRPREARRLLELYLNTDLSALDQGRLPGPSIERRAPARAFLSMALWQLGFLDQARREAQAGLDEVPAADHPFLLCRVLYNGVCRVMPTTGDFATAERDIARLIETATRIDAPFWQTMGRFLSGRLMIELGRFAEGIATLDDAFDACRPHGWRMGHTEFKGALATGLAGLGQFEEALAAVNEALDDAAQGAHGHGHDLFFAELLRIKGEIVRRRGAEATAEDLFSEAIEISHDRGALLWQLRAVLSLARVRVDQGRDDEARRIVAQVYDRFTEGFGTPDLRVAKAFLDELSR